MMGSKNLKAIVVRGTKGVEVADPKGFMRIVNGLFDCIMRLPYRDDWLGLGVSISAWGRRSSWGKVPADKAAGPYGLAELQKTWSGILTCPTCPVGCKPWLRLQEGERTGVLASFHAVTPPLEAWQQLDVGDMHHAFALADRCNRDGIDEVEIGGLFKLAITLFEEGVITLKDTDGLELKKDYETAMKLLDKLVRREGFGALLADGTPALVEAFGQEAEKYAATIKGVQPLQDPRKHFHTWSIDEMVNPRHPVGQPGNTPAFLPGHSPEDFVKYLRRLKVPEEAIRRTCTESDVNMARMARYAEDFYAACSCLGVCIRVPLVQCYGVDNAAQLFTATTGLEMDGPELMQAGERAWNLVKAANVREGYTRAEDKPPDAFFQPLVVEGKTLTLKDYYGKPLNRDAVERLLDDYYDERGWDVGKGIPTAQKLRRLGLHDIARDLEKQGNL